FSNMDGETPTLRYWSSDTGTWTDLNRTIQYDTWYEFGFRIVNNIIVYEINGEAVGTVPCVGCDEISNVMLQAYNFNDPALPEGQFDESDYMVYWNSVYTYAENVDIFEVVESDSYFQGFEDEDWAPWNYDYTRARDWQEYVPNGGGKI